MLTTLLAASSAPLIAVIVILALIVIVAISSIKIVPQATAWVIERIGSYRTTWTAGKLHFLCPFIDSVRTKVTLMEQVSDFPPQPVITKDNVTIRIDTVVFYKITDPVKAVYQIADLRSAIANIAITTIRDIIGKMDLDDTFCSSIV